MRRRILSCLLLLGIVINGKAQQTLEMYSGAGNPAGNGITTATQVITLQKNTNNPSGNTTGAYAPLVTVSYTLSNQQYTSIEGNPGIPGSVIGGDNINGDNIMDPVGIFQTMSVVGNSANTQYTACYSCAVNTGIDITANRSVYIFNAGDALLNSSAPYNKLPVNSRVWYSDITITFSQPVSDPVMHVTGLGGWLHFSDGNGIDYQHGISTEYELLTPGITLTRLSGSNNFAVAGTVVKNSDNYYGPNTAGAALAPNKAIRYGASGTVALKGTNITSATFRIYVKGDAGEIIDANGNPAAATPGNQVLWSFPANYTPNPVATSSTFNGVLGDATLLGFSLEALTYTVSGNVFNDPNGGTINNSTGAANLVPSGMFANLIDASGNVAGTAPVNTDGTYTFSGITPATYTMVLSTTQGTPGSPAPAASLPPGWVNTGESNFPAPGTPDGNINGISAPFTITNGNIGNVNFGIEQPPQSFDVSKTVDGTPILNQPVSLTDMPLQGSDPTDQPAQGSWAGKTLVITSLPTNGFTLTYNGHVITSADITAGGYVITNYDPALLILTPVTTAGNVKTTSFTYAVTDAAGVRDATPATATINFTSALPVVFGTISATLSNGSLNVNWGALKETNNDHYDIEASADGVNFTKIGEVKSRATGGNSDTALDYSFSTDKYAGSLMMSGSILAMLALGMGLVRRKAAVAGVVAALSAVLLLGGCAKGIQDLQKKEGNNKIYVRIAQVDIDGKKSYSKIVQATKE